MIRDHYGGRLLPPYASRGARLTVVARRRAIKVTSLIGLVIAGAAREFSVWWCRCALIPGPSHVARVVCGEAQKGLVTHMNRGVNLQTRLPVTTSHTHTHTHNKKSDKNNSLQLAGNSFRK